MNNYQNYYWDKDWQEGEKEANEDIKKGRIKQFDNARAVITYLKTIDFVIGEQESTND